MAEIEVDNLHFTYPNGVKALRGISLNIKGEAVAIIGQNGSGKTTLVKHFNGLLKPSRGEVYIDGQSTKNYTVAQLAHMVGYVFQNPDDQIFHNTVRKEVAFGPRNLKFEEKKVEEKVFSALEVTGLLEHIDDHPHDLSLSKRKLVAIASILAMETEVVIFDEPTTGQDHYGVRKVEGIVRSLIRRGKTVITITHDMDFVATLFPRVIVLYQGRLLLDGPPFEVFTQRDLLVKSFVESPPLTQLGQRLGFEETVLSIPSFIASLERRIGPSGF